MNQRDLDRGLKMAFLSLNYEAVKKLLERGARPKADHIIELLTILSRSQRPIDRSRLGLRVGSFAAAIPLPAQGKDVPKKVKNIIQLLVEHGADINHRSGRNSPLEFAILHIKDPNVIKLLLGLGSDPMEVREELAEMSPLIKNARKDYILSLAAKTNRNMKSKQTTPIFSGSYYDPSQARSGGGGGPVKTRSSQQQTKQALALRALTQDTLMRQDFVRQLSQLLDLPNPKQKSSKK